MRVDLMPALIRPEQPATAERRDREFTGIALKLAQASGEDADIGGPGSQCTGLMAAHLNEVEPPGDLREPGVDDQLSGRTKGAISLAGQVCQVRKQAGRIRIISRQRPHDHGFRGLEGDDRRGELIVNRTRQLVLTQPLS